MSIMRAVEEAYVADRRFTHAEALGFIGANVVGLVEDLAEYRKLAKHWRRDVPGAEPPTEVGAIGFALSRVGRLWAFSAANQNLAPGDNDTKACAELISASKMVLDEEFGDGRMILMANMGNNQPDTHSRRHLDALGMCGIERAVFSGLQLVHGDTVYASFNPDNGAINVVTHNQALALHGPDAAAVPDPRRSDVPTWQQGVAVLALHRSGLVGVDRDYGSHGQMFQMAVSGQMEEDLALAA